MKIKENPYFILAKIRYLDLKAKLSRKGKHSPAVPAKTEMLNVVDSCGEVVGTASRNDCHQKGILHQAVHILVFDSPDFVNLLVQKRSAAKDLSPGLLSQSAGGHVRASSNPNQTAAQETFEELGVRINPEYLTTFWHRSDGGRNIEHIHLYTAVHPGPFKVDPVEVDWAAFFPLKGIYALSLFSSNLLCPGFLKDLMIYQNRHLIRDTRKESLSPKTDSEAESEAVIKTREQFRHYDIADLRTALIDEGLLEDASDNSRQLGNINLRIIVNETLSGTYKGILWRWDDNDCFFQINIEAETKANWLYVLPSGKLAVLRSRDQYGEPRLELIEETHELAQKLGRAAEKAKLAVPIKEEIEIIYGEMIPEQVFAKWFPAPVFNKLIAMGVLSIDPRSKLGQVARWKNLDMSEAEFDKVLDEETELMMFKRRILEMWEEAKDRQVRT